MTLDVIIIRLIILITVLYFFFKLGYKQDDETNNINIFYVWFVLYALAFIVLKLCNVIDLPWI